MSKAFDTNIPDFPPQGNRNVGMVVKTYDNPYSFAPRKRIVASLADVANVARHLRPKAEKVTAVYFTDEPVGGWVRL